MDDVVAAVRAKQARLKELENEAAQLRRELDAIRSALGVAASNDRRYSLGVTRRGKHQRPIDPNSSVGLARKVLLKAGTPLPIDVLLGVLAADGHGVNKATLVGQLARYVQKNKVFTRPEPSTYGLIDWNPPPDGETPADWESAGGEAK